MPSQTSNSLFSPQNQSAVSPIPSHEGEPFPLSHRKTLLEDNLAPKQNTVTPISEHTSEERRIPSISRKIKACSACRRKKIKCMMPAAPPCQRCKERGLSCQLNKSLQTLMSEDSRWKSSITKDLSNVYSSLEKVLQSMSLPSLPPAQTPTNEVSISLDLGDHEQNHDDQLYENCSLISPLDENPSHAPIESLYQIAGLRSLRGYGYGLGREDEDRVHKHLHDTDLISRGFLSVEDAKYLATFYNTRLDPYVFNVTEGYDDLESLRARSSILTTCILTVAALHDTSRPNLYPKCFREFCRLVAKSMFDRRIDLEYLKAAVLGCYWLPDAAYTLSGYAIRRASEFHLSRFYTQVVESINDPNKYTLEQLQKAMDRLRLLYLLYICDSHLSILYGRSSIMRDDENCVAGWEAYLTSSLATDSDKRIACQLALCVTMNKIRESFGEEESNTPLPALSVLKINSLKHELEAWASRHAYPSKLSYRVTHLRFTSFSRSKQIYW